MNYKTELEQMRSNYKKHRILRLELPRPSWLSPKDRLGKIYGEKEILINEGEIYYAAVVQANELLFKFFPHNDYPANLIFSDAEEAGANPSILFESAWSLYSYKNLAENEIPEEYREIARIITDEYDRSACVYTEKYGEQEIRMFFNANIIFRKYLPHGKICSSLIPVIALPGKCESVIPLPKRYWTKAFKKAWVKRKI